jgi:hypothetical protein
VTNDGIVDLSLFEFHTCDNPALGPKIQHLDNQKLSKSSEFAKNIPKIQRVQENVSS